MKLIGVDIDETLCGKHAGRFADIAEALRQEIVDGSECVLITSRADPVEGQQQVWDTWGFNLPCISVTRDWPQLKGLFLVEYRYSLPQVITSTELWDDECWYLDPASKLGIITRRAYKGCLIEHTCQPGYKPWVPKTPRPNFALLARLP